MRIRKERKQELFNAISSHVTDLRVKMKTNPNMSRHDIDAELYDLVFKIWKKQEELMKTEIKGNR